MPKNKPSKPIHYPKEFLKEKEKEWIINHLVANSYVLAFDKRGIPGVFAEAFHFDNTKAVLWIVTKGVDECMDKNTGEFISSPDVEVQAQNSFESPQKANDRFLDFHKAKFESDKEYVLTLNNGNTLLFKTGDDWFTPNIKRAKIFNDLKEAQLMADSEVGLIVREFKREIVDL